MHNSSLIRFCNVTKIVWSTAIARGTNFKQRKGHDSRQLGESSFMGDFFWQSIIKRKHKMKHQQLKNVISDN